MGKKSDTKTQTTPATRAATIVKLTKLLAKREKEYQERLDALKVIKKQDEWAKARREATYAGLDAAMVRELLEKVSQEEEEES